MYKSSMGLWFRVVPVLELCVYINVQFWLTLLATASEYCCVAAGMVVYRECRVLYMAAWQLEGVLLLNHHTGSCSNPGQVEVVPMLIAVQVRVSV